MKNWFDKFFTKNLTAPNYNLITLGIVGAIGHPLYWLWWTYVDIRWENIFLRIIGTLSCLILLFHQKWPKFLQKYLNQYFFFAVTYNFPFFFTVYLINNDFSSIWMMAEVGAVLLMLMLMKNRYSLLSIIVGISAAIFYCYLTGFNFSEFNSKDLLYIYFPAFLFVFLAGLIINYGNILTVTTERKKITEALSASIAHEMRNPLNAVNLSLNEISEAIVKNDFEKIEEYKLIASNSIKRANQVINLILAELKNQKVEVQNFANISIIKLIEKVVSEYGYTNREEKQRIVLDLKNDFAVRVDETLLIYVLFNLIKNALYYHGSIITISGFPQEDANYITIHDSGPGIAPEKLDRLFRDFYTADKKGGTGLGLSFCKRTIKSFGGDIGCESELNKYTKFIIKFPKIANLETIKNINQTPVNLENKKILLTDDHDVNRMLTARYLAKYGAIIHQAINGNEALEKINQENYDLILMDIEMPIKDGITATKEIRQILKIQIPIIAITGNDHLNLNEMLSHGFNDCFSKGRNYEDLIEMIRFWMGKNNV